MLAIAAASALLLTGASGCDFFKELESLPGAGETGGETDAGTGETFGDGTGGEPCDVLDERCSDQDTLHACDYESGEMLTLNCASVCGQSLLNFTCTPTADFRHACWCVSPGAFKLRTCAELEQCIIDCGDPDSDCASACFEDTDAQTARLLGALYSCADQTCDNVCAASPADCGSCLLAARAGLWGDCGVERSVCDADETDEPSWP